MFFPSLQDANDAIEPFGMSLTRAGDGVVLEGDTSWPGDWANYERRREERTLKGSYIGTCVPTRDIPRYVALYRAGRLPVDRLVSGYLTLADINRGFDDLHAGRAVRQIVRFDT